MDLHIAVEKQGFVISELLRQETKQYGSINESHQDSSCKIPMNLVKELQTVLHFLTKQL